MHFNLGRRSRSAPLAGLWLALQLGTVGPAMGADLKLGDESSYLKIGLLLQGWTVIAEEGAPNPDSLDTDFYLRRLRVLLFGQLNDRVNFFVETDNPNFGKQGDLSSTTFVQDAWVEFNLHEAAQIDFGMLLVPFSHHGMQGATSLHALDYHTDLVRYPTGSHKVWRDFGVMVRGLILHQILEYRLAILNGVHGKAGNITDGADPRNPNDWPRVTAHLTLNLFEAEGGAGGGGFFYDGLYLKRTEIGVVSTRKILSLGLSTDWQKDLNVSLSQTGDITKRTDYFAVAADVFFDLPLDAEKLVGFSGQLNFSYHFYDNRQVYPDQNPRSFYGTDDKFKAEYTGYGLLGELGLRYDAYEIMLSLDWLEATQSDGDAGDLLSVYGGINWWWFGHSASIKLQLGETKKGGGAWGLVGQLQLQLLL